LSPNSSRIIESNDDDIGHGGREFDDDILGGDSRDEGVRLSNWPELHRNFRLGSVHGGGRLCAGGGAHLGRLQEGYACPVA